MGLVTRRSEQLDKLFDQFAVDPKKPKATKKNDDKKEKDSKDKEKKTFTPFYGSLYGQAALPIQPDTITYLTNDTLESIQVWNFEKQKMEPVYQPNSENIDSYDLFLSGPTPLLEIENPNQADGELIIFRDSFASSLTPLMIESYHHITLIDLRYISTDLLENLVDFTNKDILFLYSVPVINQSSILK